MCHVPEREWTSSDVSTSYRLAARSQEAVTTCRPPTSQSAAITTPWWLFRVAVATLTVGTSQGPSPSTSPSSRSEESWSSSHGAYGGNKGQHILSFHSAHIPQSLEITDAKLSLRKVRFYIFNMFVVHSFIFLILNILLGSLLWKCIDEPLMSIVSKSTQRPAVIQIFALVLNIQWLNSSFWW